MVMNVCQQGHYTQKIRTTNPYTISGSKAANKIVLIFLSEIEYDVHKKAEFFTLLIQQIMC